MCPYAVFDDDIDDGRSDNNDAGDCGNLCTCTFTSIIEIRAFPFFFAYSKAQQLTFPQTYVVCYSTISTSVCTSLFGTLNNKVSSLSVINFLLQRNGQHGIRTAHTHCARTHTTKWKKKKNFEKINFIVPHLYIFLRYIWNSFGFVSIVCGMVMGADMWISSHRSQWYGLMVGGGGRNGIDNQIEVHDFNAIDYQTVNVILERINQSKCHNWLVIVTFYQQARRQTSIPLSGRTTKKKWQKKAFSGSKQEQSHGPSCNCTFM